MRISDWSSDLCSSDLTLLNALAGRDVAIVSPIACTTRDRIETPVAINGVPFLFIDTAGLREKGGDEIEGIGIDLAQRAMEDSDLVLWLGEPSQGPHNLAAKVVRIAPKSDLGSPNPHGCDLTLSALTGEGMLQLQTLLMDRARALLPREGEYALNKRQRVALASLQTELESAIRTEIGRAHV